MLYKLTEEERATINQIMEITLTNYEVEGLNIPVDSLIVALEDLLCEYHKKEEELEDLKADIEENYKPKKINYYDEYGLNENDFH